MVVFLINKPFEESFDNRINIFNEIILLFGFISTLIINNCSFEEVHNELCGWITIVLILISLIATWVHEIPSVVKELANNCCKSKKNKKKKSGIKSKTIKRIIVRDDPMEKYYNLNANTMIADLNKEKYLV